MPKFAAELTTGDCYLFEAIDLKNSKTVFKTMLETQLLMHVAIDYRIFAIDTWMAERTDLLSFER